MKRLVIALIAFIAASPAFGQALLQGGAWTQGHSPMYVGGSNSQPIVQDSGPASGGGIGLGLAEQLLSVRSTTNSYPAANAGTGPLSTNWCDYDGPTTNATGYHYLCMSPNAQGGGLITYGFAGGATALPFTFNINGTAYQFPFTTTGVVGPGVSVVNDVACWNNTAGTLLKDCGAAVSASSNNTWTGTNNFTSTFQIGGVAQTFPPSGLIVGTSDVQTLTNKSISAGQINSGVLNAAQMPALTGDVTSAAGSVATTIAANAVTNAKLAQVGANTIKGNPTGATANEQDISMPSCSATGNALQWLAGTGIQCATITGQTAGWGLSGTSTFQVSTTAPPFGFDVPINMTLSASAAASALTINVTTADTGLAPTSSHPVLIPFRATSALTNGQINWRAITSSLSITVPSGATLGTTNNVPFRIWIFAAFNAGTPELGVATCSNATQVYPCSSWEYTLVNTTTISGLSTSGGTLYVSTTGQSLDAVRIIGFCDFASGLATVGAWASSCTTLQVFGPGIKKPGDIVQANSFSSTTQATTNSTTKVATTVVAAITPTAAMNLVKVSAYGALGTTGTTIPVFSQIWRGTGTTALGNISTVFSTSTQTNSPAVMFALDAPGATTSTQYGVYINCGGACTNSGTWLPTNGSIPANSGSILLEEIMGALEPANDNDLPLTMTG